MEEYESQYHEIWDSLGSPENVKTVIEIGINEGVGTLRLKNHFPHAQIFAIDVHVRHSNFQMPYDEIMAKLENVATVIIQKSPFPFEWPYPYDVCTIDIDSDPEVNFKNIEYWLKYKNPGGVLAVLIPKGDERKLARKEKFMEMLQTTNWTYKQVRPNWFIFT